MKYSLGRERIDTLPKHMVLEELRRVAQHYDYRRFSRQEKRVLFAPVSPSTGEAMQRIA